MIYKESLRLVKRIARLRLVQNNGFPQPIIDEAEKLVKQSKNFLGEFFEVEKFLQSKEGQELLLEYTTSEKLEDTIQNRCMSCKKLLSCKNINQIICLEYKNVSSEN